MNLLIATDKFKDALDAPEVCLAIERGIRQVMPSATVRSFLLADGGEGTARILALHSGGQEVTCQVKDPLFRPVEAAYGLSGDGKTAFIEMAQASGLHRLKPEERNPLHTSSFGTGELIADALRRGVQKIVLGIGGSATNDAGMGMAAALGYAFPDEASQLLEPVGGNLSKVHRIEGEWPAAIEVEVLCDVDNPLYGPKGAAQVYGPQKGATPEVVKVLDAGLKHFARVLETHTGKALADVPGAGAAGGLGAGAMAFLNARLLPGIETIMAYTEFEAALKGVDLIVTGEGKIDGQTSSGKLISGIARKAAAHNIPVLAFCGALEASAAEVRALGLMAAFPILAQPQSLEEALRHTAVNLEQTAARVFSLISWTGPGKANTPNTNI